MPVQYTNRSEKTYTLFEGKTKTGKPRYFFSLNTGKGKAKGEPLEQIPPTHEIYERPENGQVFLRKKRPRLITDSEKQLVEQSIKQQTSGNSYLVDDKDEFITIYESVSNTADLKGILADIMGKFATDAGGISEDALNAAVNVAGGEYRAVLRFELINEETRRFVAQRYCFRGAIDDWIPSGGSDSLANLASNKCPDLGSDDFFESPYL